MSRSDLGTSDGRRWLPWAVAGGLCLAVAIVYGPTLWFGFMNYDDNTFVTACPEVQAGLTGKSIAWAFTTGPQREWYPLAMLSHMLDCQLFGQKPWGHHLTNLLLHAATAVGLFFVLCSMTAQRAVPEVAQAFPASGARGGTSERREGRASGPERDNAGRVAPAGPSATTLWPSALVAALFAIHPQRVESVAWIAERRDVLSGLFFVLVLAAYLGYVRGGRAPGRYLIVALLLALGLMAKAMLVTLPAVLLLLDYWPLGRFGQTAERQHAGTATPQSFGRLVVEKLPLVAIALGACLMTWTSQTKGTDPHTPLARMANALVALVEYVVQFFCPIGLAVFYPFPAAGHPVWQVAGAGLVLVAITTVAVLLGRRMPYVLVGWLWFVGMLVPVLELVQVGDHAMADRYMYLPGIGLSIALVWPIWRTSARSVAGRWVLAGVASAAMVVLVAMALVQVGYWHDDLALWQHALLVTEDNSEAEFGLAEALRKADRINEAIQHYRRAAAFPTKDSTVANNLAGVMRQLGDADEAIAQYRRALAIDANNARAQASYGTLLVQLGRAAEGGPHLERAIQIDPSLAGVHVFLAKVYLQAGRLDDACHQLEQAAEKMPDKVSVHNDLAVLLAQQGNFDRARAEFQAALAIDPSSLLARVNLAKLWAQSGQTEAAIAEYEQALRIDPDQPAVRKSLEELRRLPQP